MGKVLFLTLCLISLSLQRSPVTAECPQGHLPFGGKCNPITYVEGCSSYLPDNKCQVCEYGYTQKRGKCQVNTNQTKDCCASYSSDGTCLQCSSGLFPSDPYCYRNEIYGCIVKVNNLCQVCGYGLALQNGACITPIAECASYDENGICFQCNPHHKLINNYCYPFPHVPNCNIPNDHGCIQCQNGYYLTPRKTCAQYEPGCLMYWKGVCTTCLPNFSLHKGRCFIHYCLVYFQDACKQCHQGYQYYNGKCQYNGCLKVVNNKCVECRDELRLSAQGCVQPADYQCTTCAQGYQWVNNACVKIIYGCLKYKGSSQCQQCAEPFQLTVNGQCQILGCQKYYQQGCTKCFLPFMLNNNICSIQYCSKYSSRGCTQCQQGYLLADRLCHPKDPNCKTYDLINLKPTCTQCVDKYYLFNGQCKPAEKGCIYNQEGQCECKSQFMMRQGQCQIVGCSSYSWQTCLSCYSPFQYDQQSQLCFIPYCLNYNWEGCVSCEKGWLINNGVCMKGDPQCISYSSSGKCQACKEGFVLSSAGCRKNIPFCSQFSSDLLSCKTCQSGYTLFQGLCKKVIPNCQTMDFNNDLCTCCNQNYYLINGECFQKDPNCLSYAPHQNQPNTEVCQVCQQGYLFDPNSNQCQPNTPGCVYDGSNCVSCIQPFQYDAQRGLCFIPGCNKYNEVGCQYCVFPFSLINSNCVIKYCRAYSNKSCLECENGYTALNEGYCVKFDPNCLTYKGVDCYHCKDQFSLVNGLCVIKDPNCVAYQQNGLCSSCRQNYHVDHNAKCQPDEPGCIYTNGICTSCSAPFQYIPLASICEIPNCKQADSSGCLSCKAPFELNQNKQCVIQNCLDWDYNGCIRCKPFFHNKNFGCMPDSPDCLIYSAAGNCDLCAKDFVVGANGECVRGNQACIKRCPSSQSKCLECSQAYFLNRFFQCQKKDKNCQAYTNGVCSKCQYKFFLYNQICFPYTPGCVQYSGKDCTQCRNNYVLKNGECFHWKGQKMDLMGGDDVYDFEITPIDVRQSKYYIDNLSPASAIGTYFYSSSYGSDYQDCSLSTLEGYVSKGWKAKTANANQYIGVTLTGEPATFYALQLESVEASYISEYYLEYSLDGNEFIRVQNAFAVPSSIQNGITTIYFTAIYAQSIRIKISKFHGWPAARLEFFYYDMIRFRKISNLKSLTYLQETINSNFVDRVDNQIYINQVYFFDPSASCSVKQMCFTGLQLCEPRQVTDLTLTFEDPNNYVTEFYLTYSVDGRSYNCYKNCKKYTVEQFIGNSYSVELDGLRAQGVRVYPTNYKGTPIFSPTFYYN